MDARSDFNGDGRSDILWRNGGTGALVSWLGQDSGGFVNNPGVSGQVAGEWYVTGTGDFNGDGRSDILWRNGGTGALVSWLGQDSGGFVNNPGVSGQVAGEWYVTGTGDFNGDGRDDILWRNDTGAIVTWLSQADGSFSNNPNGAVQGPTDRFVIGTGDFNGDGRDDVLWTDNSDSSFISSLGQADGSFASNLSGTGLVPFNWHVTGTGDFNGDGRDDVLWRDDNGAFVSWLGQADGSFVNNANGAGQVPTDWHVADTGDYNGDGRDDILWRNDNGAFVSWLGHADGTFTSNPNVAGQMTLEWQIEPLLDARATPNPWDY